MMDDDLPTRFSQAQAAGMERIAADEEAFAAMVAMFEWVHGRQALNDLEVYAWGAKTTDENLTAFGFDGRSGFSYCYDCALAVSGPRAGDRVH
jgi:hypothetical protein